MKASLAVARLSAPPASSRARKRGIASSARASVSDAVRVVPAVARRAAGRTNSTSSATPRIATQKLTRKIELNASGATASIENATSGPIIAPVVSRARCTPKAAPSCGSGVESEIIASRGAVRMPLPMRSSSTTAPIDETAVPIVASRSLQIAERP